MCLLLQGTSFLPEVRTQADCSQLTFHWAECRIHRTLHRCRIVWFWDAKAKILWREREEESAWSCAPDLSHTSQGQPETAILSSHILLTSIQILSRHRRIFEKRCYFHEPLRFLEFRVHPWQVSTLDFVAVYLLNSGRASSLSSGFHL